MKWTVLLLFCVTAVVLGAGCTSPGAKETVPLYSLDDTGALSIVGITSVYEESPSEISPKNGSVVLSRLIFSDNYGNVHAILAAPAHPVAAVVMVPGAGVAATAHQERAVTYAERGIAMVVLDLRGNGGETTGHTDGLSGDLRRFTSGTTPQWYLTIGDIMAARMMLTERFGVPVYIIGSSNGGMTGAVAASIDSGDSGYFGVSTSGISAGDDASQDVLSFVRSVDPGAYVAGISPDPVWLFHSPSDSVIPYQKGLSLFNAAEDPKNFESFNGTHGITPEVDTMITGAILTF
ncbi:S9 family peptidase [Methanogenium marinum]|uniref:S9 family peptidase n=1 Tax=Methanogenium marinum TaxID=348610 RepID=A0A9Q4KU10_9EURY|nr:hypothetical protein [Methanogenium marinum]MDE4908624.1 S9 family peptidase [Methanogenium marinum]